jgi:HD-like signal output (HDOD) protein
VVNKLDTLASVDVPGSIRRIEAFPASALALLNQIPPRPDTVQQLDELLTKEPLLVQAMDQIAVASGKYEAGQALGLSAMMQRIGAAELIDIAITLLLRGYMHRALNVIEDQRYWRYTLACAVSCQEIALPGEANGLFAYIGGLLHDIGRLALVAAYPDKYANLLTLIDRMFREETNFDLLAREEMMFGMDHFATGTWLATEWRLPPWLHAVTGRFKEDTSGEYHALVATVRSGTRLAHSLGFGYLEAAPRAEIKEIFVDLPEVWKRWQNLDHWKHAEDHVRSKIQSKLALYAPATEESD